MQFFYTVRAGDTLYAISERWGIPWDTLAFANQLSAPYILRVGQQLSVPPGVNTVVVQRGESVFSISQRYGIPPEVIIAANRLQPPYTIMPEQVLEVPPGVPYYIVQPGDTLYSTAWRYNVTLNSQPRPDYILEANPGLTPSLRPGMAIRIPYPPPGGLGRIAYVAATGQGYGLWLLNPVTKAKSLLTDVAADKISVPYWSPDASKIAFIGVSGVIHVIDVNTKQISRIDQLDVNTLLTLDWSPDSRKLAYSKGNNIVLYDITSHTFSTIDRPGARNVRWLPNGTEVLFVDRDSPEADQLYIMSTDGSNVRQISDNPGGSYNFVSVSPDGRFVSYTLPGVSISEVYTMELSTLTQRHIPGGPEGKNYYPAWSPDSKRLAFSSTFFRNKRYYSQIRTAEAEGQNSRIWAISSCFSTPVTWSPDHRKIAYLSDCSLENGAAMEMWSIDIERPAPIRILGQEKLYSLSWSPG